MGIAFASNSVQIDDIADVEVVERFDVGEFPVLG